MKKCFIVLLLLADGYIFAKNLNEILSEDKEYQRLLQETNNEMRQVIKQQFELQKNMENLPEIDIYIISTKMANQVATVTIPLFEKIKNAQNELINQIDKKNEIEYEKEIKNIYQQIHEKLSEIQAKFN